MRRTIVEAINFISKNIVIIIITFFSSNRKKACIIRKKIIHRVIVQSYISTIEIFERFIKSNFSTIQLNDVTILYFTNNSKS